MNFALLLDIDSTLQYINFSIINKLSQYKILALLINNTKIID